MARKPQDVVNRSPDIQTTRQMRFPSPSGGQWQTPPVSGIPPVPAIEKPGESPFVRLVFPPRIEKIGASRDFHVQDFVMAVPAGAGSTVSSAGSSFRLPQDNVGWLQQFGLYILAPVATTRLQWTVRINQGPVPGFDNFQNPPGATNALLIITNEMRVRVPNNALVDVLITNLDGAAVTAGAFLAGWYHPIADEIRIFGEGVSD